MSSGRTLGQLLFSSSSLMSLFLLFSSPPLPHRRTSLLPSLLSHRRSWPSGPGILTLWRVSKRTPSTPSPWLPSQAKASALSLTNWCRGHHKPVRLDWAGFTVFLHTPTHIPQIQILLCLFIYLFNVLCREYLGNILSSKRSHTQLVAVHFPQLPAW